MGVVNENGTLGVAEAVLDPVVLEDAAPKFQTGRALDAAVPVAGDSAGSVEAIAAPDDANDWRLKDIGGKEGIFGISTAGTGVDSSGLLSSCNDRRVGNRDCR